MENNLTQLLMTAKINQFDANSLKLSEALFLKLSAKRSFMLRVKSFELP